jgi:hypothetical protein
MRINPLLAPAFFIVILIGSIAVAQLTGNWNVSGQTTIDTENLAVADIKGWMTLQQVIDGFHISKEELYPLINVPAEIPTTTALKDLESIVPGFETSTVRDALTARLGTGQAVATPISPSSAPTVQPTVQLTLMATPRPSMTPLPAGEVLPASQIKGKMTLREISDQCGVPLDALLQGLKLSPTIDPNTSVKTLVDQGLLTEVSEAQTVVATLQK